MMERESKEARARAEAINGSAEVDNKDSERFRNRAAICVSVLAVLLAISSFNTASYVRQLINTNIHANADEALLHIKDLEQKSNELAVDELRVTLAVEKRQLSETDQALLRQEIHRYEIAMVRLENDPQTGQGKKQIDAAMRGWLTEHHLAEEHLLSFESADIVYQIAIVLCSVCIILKSRRILHWALVFGAGASLFALNGFLLWAKW
jgi:hypothetical protein